MKNIVFIIVALLLFGCNSEESNQITTTEDYDKYLNTQVSKSEKAALDELSFWQGRFKNDSTKIIELGKLAGVNSSIFNATGDVTRLYKAEKLLKKAIEVSAEEKDSYMRALAHNYISQHRFKEAKILLDSAYAFPDNKRETELMLFDVAMELGNYKTADTLLGKVKNNSDYNYLIRLSKWSDYKGDLDAAIRYMEQAKAVSESRGIPSLKVWTYSNIADYYGHAGRISDSYQHYLKTLELDNDNAYAKKGIAWIAYSLERNTSEANRILDSIMVHHKSPDHYLLKSEMAEFDSNSSEAKRQKDNFINAVESGDYGNMYNTYLIELYADSNPKKALELAKKEVENRATPETYQLLAYAQLKMGNREKALYIIENFVEGKTFEPMAQYYSALVYKANYLDEKVVPLKKELLDAAYELGPVMFNEIEKL